MNTTPTATDFLKAAIHTAEFFGFRSVDELKKAPECKSCQDKIQHSISAAERKKDALSGLLTSGAAAYCDARLNGFQGPTLFYAIDRVPRTNEVALSLHVFGVDKSIAEAILIQATRGLLNDLGYTDHSVRVNSIGDQESMNRYVRELTNYLRKRIEQLSPAARELMKEHVLETLMHLIENQDDLALRSPSPLEYLSDQSRKHFREIVEYLDMSATPYEIDPKLIRHHQCYSDALFTFDIFDEDGVRFEEPPVVASGGRYSEFVYRTTKLKTAAAGAVIMLREKKAPAQNPRVAKNSNPSVYIVQLGFGPKIRSLMLIDELRRSGIQVHQNLACDSLSTQLRDAEAKNVKHTIIIGQKEYVDGTVILRDMHARSQEHVPQTQLSTRLRRFATNA